MTPCFLDKLDAEQVDAEDWLLLSQLRYQPATFPLITAPAGFITDFASTPQIVWSLGMPKSGEYDRAAVIHDLIYKFPGIVPGYRFTKPEADSIFDEAMGVLGVNPVKRWLMYQAVRIGGRGSF